MVAEVVLPPEGLVADVARVGPLVRVRPLVDEQVVGLGEVAPAELADELLLGLGREAAPRGLPLRGELAQRRRQGAAQLGQLAARLHRSRRGRLGQRRVLLRGGRRQVRKVKAGPLLAEGGGQHMGDGGRLLGVEEVRGGGEGQRRREAGEALRQALRRCHLAQRRRRAAAEVARRPRAARRGRGGGGRVAAQRPVVHVHRVHGAEAVEALQVVHGRRERVDGLQEGVVGQLQRRVKRDRGRQRFAPHRPGRRGSARRSARLLRRA